MFQSELARRTADAISVNLVASRSQSSPHPKAARKHDAAMLYGSGTMLAVW